MSKPWEELKAEAKEGWYRMRYGYTATPAPGPLGFLNPQYRSNKPAPHDPAPTPPPPPDASADAGYRDVEARLRKVYELHQNRLTTDEDFEPKPRAS